MTQETIPSSDTMGNRLTKYEPALDGMRAFAVLSVVLFHASPARFPGGWVGVDIFFVMSGFLITSLINQEIEIKSRLDFKRFYLRRLLRLAPALVALLLVDLLLSNLTAGRDAVGATSIIISALYLMNLNRAFSIFPSGYLGHTWSLSLEEQFYLIWPFLFSFIRVRRPLRWITTFIILITVWRLYLVVAGASPDRIYNGPDTHSDALLIGCLLSLLPLNNLIETISRRYIIIPLAALLFIFFTFGERDFFTHFIGLSITGLASAWLIIAVIQEGRLRQLLSAKFLVFTGRISYGWYLWHYFLYSFGMDHMRHFAGISYVLVFIAYPVAVISFIFVEKPFLKLKARAEPTADRSQQQLQTATLP